MAAWGRLRVLDGSHEGSVFVLEGEVHTLGRGQASDFRLADPTVSRVQAEFRATPDGIRISGLSDKNPVWVNGEPAGRGRTLSYGDKVQCGLVHLVFEEAPAAPARAPVLAVTTGSVSSLEGIPAAPASGDPPAAGTLPGPGASPSAPKGPACARCGTKEAPGARFCGSCGAALAGSVPLPATAVTRVPAPEEPAAATLNPPTSDPISPPRTGTQSQNLPPLPVRTDTMARPPESLDGLDALPGPLRGAPPPAPGSVLKGRFELRRHIAHGRVTEVYEAFDRETRTTVTVKVLLPALAADLEVRDWFFHAANALVVAAHPNLLRVHSVHESGATCFTVSDFLAGVPLRDQMRSRPASMGGYDPAEVRRVGTALCEALSRLHEVGPHGDVVPGNVWIDPQGKVTLLDAGLSTVPGRAVRWPPTSDLASAVYSAPEVLRGAAPDARSDLYAVGAILYQMLTAELPAGRIAPVAQARSGLPPDLTNAVDRAMSPRPEDRFASAKDMWTFLTGDLETRRRAGFRKRTIAAAAAAVLAAVGASSVYWYAPAVAWRRKAFADPVAVERARKARGEVADAERSLAALAEFTSAPALDSAREAVRRGDVALDEWRLEEAEGEFSRALLGMRQEERSASEAQARRRELVEKAEARLRELDHEIDRAGAAGVLLGGTAAEFQRRASAVTPSAAPGSALAACEIAERRAALDEACARAGNLERSWRPFSTGGEAVSRARRDLAEAKATLAEGKAAKAETAARESIARLRREIGEELKSLLRVLCKDAGVPRPAAYEEAESALGAAVHEGTLGDADAAAATFDRALSGFVGVVDTALESVRVSVEAREQRKRCPRCRGEGRCATCDGGGVARVPCAACAGKGVLDAPCTSCDEEGRVPCGKCEAGQVRRACEECRGAKEIPCTVCKGAPAACSNPNCKAGKVPCLWCKNGIVTASGPDKGKPCSHGCTKGWNDCPRCRGLGTAMCEACKGTTKERCPSCEGRGTKPFPCPDCDGRGKVPCPDCGGTRARHPDCPKCDGGTVVSTCPACGGRKACPECEGRGRKE